MTVSDDTSPHRRQRVIGALVGSIVGDALGAPFEFGPPGQYTARFPHPAHAGLGEMTGGQGWGPGEWTDDTQMALLVAASLLDQLGLDPADLYGRFRTWLHAGPTDVGIQTRAVLANPDWRSAAHDHFAAGHPAAGNGSLMRTVPAAIWASQRVDTMDVARQISALTHGDPAAGEACAIYHRLIAAALDGEDPLDGLPGILSAVHIECQPLLAEVLHLSLIHI